MISEELQNRAAIERLRERDPGRRVGVPGCVDTGQQIQRATRVSWLR